MKPRNPSRQPLGLIVLAFATAGLAPFLSPSARATTIYWDTNGATVGSSAGTTASGTWDTNFTGNWSTSSLGLISTMNYTTAAGTPSLADVFFSAGTNATGASTITLDALGLTSGIVARGITIEEGAITTTTANIGSLTGPLLTLGSGGINLATTAAGASSFDSNTSIGLSSSQAWTNFNVTAANTFTAAGAITSTQLSGTTTLSLTGVNTGNNTLSGIIGNGTTGATVALTKSGTGTWLLTGANTYTGLTSVNAGILNLGGGTANGSISSSSALSLGGGTLTYTKTGTNTQTFNGTAIASGYSNLNTTVATNTLALGTLTQTSGSGGTVNFGTTGTTTASATLSNAIIGGWATTGNAGVASAGGDWATISGGNVVTYTGYTDVISGTTVAPVSTANWRTTVGGQANLVSSGTINSLVMRGDFNIANGQTLVLGSGGLIMQGTQRWLKNNGAGSSAGTGILTSGLASGELFVHVAKSDATDWTIWTKVANNGGTAVKLVKDGPGRLDLGNFNTYTGGTVVNGGTLRLNVGGATGTIRGTLTVNTGGTVLATAANALGYTSGIRTDIANINGGVLDTNAAGDQAFNTTFNMTGGTLTSNGGTSASGATSFWVVASDTGGASGVNSLASDTTSLIAGRLDVRNVGANNSVFDVATGTTPSGIDLLISAAVTGNGPLVKSGTGTMKLTGTNTFTGNTSISNGTVSVSTIGNSGASGNVGAGTTINFGSGATNGTLLYTGTGETSTKVINLSTSLGTGGAIIDQSGTGLLKFSGTNTATGAASHTITLQGSTAGTGEISGAIVDNTTTNKTSVTKAGTGLWTLSGTSTYTGATTVNAGTLAVTGSLAAGSAVTVNAGAILAGTATVGGSSTLAGDVTVAGGASSRGTISLVNGSNGTLNTGALTIGGLSGDYSQLNLDLFTSGITTTADKIASSGIFTLNAGGSNITITLAGGTPNSGTYDLLTFAGGAGAGYSIGTGTAVSGLTLTNPSLTFGVTGSLNVTSTAVQLAVSATAAPATAYWLGNLGTTWASNNNVIGNFSTDKAGASAANALPGAITDVFFAATPSIASSTLTNTLAQDFSIRSLTFEGDTSASNISGTSVLTIGTGGITLASGNGGTTLAMTGLALGAPQSWANASSNDLTVSASITGGNALTINNTSTGKTVFSGTNTYSGPTALNNGILKAGSTGAFSANSAYTLANTAGVTLDITGFNTSAGSLAGGGALGGNVTLGTATLSAGADNTGTTYAGVISGTGGFTKTGTGAMVLTGTNGYTGATTINGGTLTASGGSAIADASAVVLANTAGTIFNLANSETIGSLAGGGTSGGTITLGANTLTAGADNTTTTYAGVISGTGGALIKNGTGLLALTNTNTYTGDTTVNNGTLATGGSLAANQGGFGSGTVTVNTGGILRLGYAVSSNNNNVQIANNMVLAGGSIFADDAYQNINGTLSVTSAGTLGSTYNSGANANGERNKGLFINGVVSGSATLTLQHSGISTGNAYNTSIVYFTNAANTYSGTVTVTPMAGSNTTSGGSFLGINASTALQFATVNLNGNSTATRFGTSPIVFNAGLGTATLGALSGSGNVVLTGYNETTHVYGADSIALTVGGNNDNTTYSGIVSGAGSLTKTGTGTMTLTGTNTFTGATILNGGTLLANGTNQAASGMLSSTSGITINNGGTLSSNENGLFGHGGTAEKNITVNAGGTITAAAGVNVNVGLVTLNGGTMANDGAAATWGSWTFRHTGDKLAVTENSTVSAQNVFMKTGASIDVSSGKNLYFTGTLTNADSDGAGALVKIGDGKLTLSNTNTYTGTTSVNAGKLLVSGSIGSSAVTVTGTGTTLASGTNGTIGNSVTINNGAILAAGDTDVIGTATVGSGGTTLNSGSIFSWDLDTTAANTAGTGYDNVVTGSLAGEVGGASAVFAVVLKNGQSFTDSFWNSSHSWDNVFSSTGLAADALGMSSVFSSFTYNGSTSAPVSGAFIFTGTGGNTLTWSAVPEPSAALAGLLVGAGLLRRRRI